jgi:biopolymer transport protein ExbD
MARKKRNVDVDSSEMDLTSMIDVCFLLIAFFIMVTEVSKAEVVEIFLPHASHAKEDVDPPDNRLIVNIDRKGEIYIKSENYGKPNVPENRTKIEIALAAYSDEAGFEEAPPNVSKLTVLVRADAHAEYRYVQCLMMMLSADKVKVQKINYSANNPIKKT